MEFVFKKITDLCPEQWEVYAGSKKVGYIRLRCGHLTCRYPDYKGDVIYSHHFNDDMKGCFDSDEERNLFLMRCSSLFFSKIIKELLKELNEGLDKLYLSGLSDKQIAFVEKLQDKVEAFLKESE